jgi:hypothetical protein
MGECAYYLKAQFLTAKDAKKAGEELDAFFSEAREAYDFYQGVNSGLETGSPENFWITFESKFPIVTDYAKTLPGYGKDKSHTVLSGLLDFGQDENNETRVDGDTIGWGDAAVWHMADWSALATYIQTHFGAVKCVWDTEENGCGSLNSLMLYDYEEIINSLLKHTELFPLLLRVHDDLDKLLDMKIRTSTKGTKREKKK